MINLSIILASNISQRKGLAIRLVIIILIKVNQVMVAGRLVCELPLKKRQVDENSSLPVALLKTEA